MSQIPNLDNSPINLTAIRDRAQSELENILENIPGDKCLVIDPKLSGSLSLVIQSSDLTKHGAELRHLTAEPVVTDLTTVVYLVRARIDLMKFICSNILSDTSKGLHREYHLYFVPRRLLVCEKILEDEKVHELVMTIGEFPLYMIPLDDDILSFELDDGDDATSLWHIAKSIHNLEFAHGVIPDIRAKGKASTRVADILNRMEAEEPVNATNLGMPEINTLILLDREVDMITPMCFQLTYEGLIDEFLSINSGLVELDASIIGAQNDDDDDDDGGKKVKVALNSSDKLFKEVRDMNFGAVCQVLHQKTTSMNQHYREVSTTSGTTPTVSDLKDFVKNKLNSFPETTRHVNLAHHLSTFTAKPSFEEQLIMEQRLLQARSYDICFDDIEEMMHKQEPLSNVLRLLILCSITNSGLPKGNFDYLRREFLHSYGFEHIATLNNLEKAGLFKEQDSRSNWMTIKRALRLLVEKPNIINPNDISYVFSSYAPLSIRLVQQAIQSGWRPIEDILKLLPGPHSEVQRGGVSSTPLYDSLVPGSLNHSDKLAADGRRALVLVVFIGGVTFAEIAALRFLASQEGMACDLIIATTKIINGRTLIENFIERLG